MQKLLKGKRWLRLTMVIWLVAPSVLSATDVEVARDPRGPWKTYPTRTLSDLPELAAMKPDAGLSQYGGWKVHQSQSYGFLLSHAD